MTMNKSSVLQALLGVAAGIILCLVIQSIGRNRQQLKVRNDGWHKLELVLDCIDRNYVDTVDRSRVGEEAIIAALSALDPHSIYMPPQELKASNEDLAGGFDGIGIQFNVPNDTAVVIEVIPGGPSEKIGLQPGDRLLKVDTTSIAGVKYPQDSMVRRIKGKAGTKITVTVRRGQETIPFEITRGKIPTHSVDAAFMVDDSTAYVRLSKFSRNTATEFVRASLELLGKGMKKMVLDLRDNPGGYLDQALTLSNMFLPKGAGIVYMEGLHCRREDYRADGRGPLKDVGLSVLVNENSASSSEIFAGAMQDNGRGIIVGRRTFGKGLVQEPFFFSDGSGMRITIARYYTPSGRCIQKPYNDSEEYLYEVYKRYDAGEMVIADSMKVEKGGILPDIFVPIDTTKAGRFYIASGRKATPMRFASAFFDAHKAELSPIDDWDALTAFLDGADLEKQFLDFAASKDALVPSPSEWETDRQYVMTQVKALVSRYSKLSDNAYYRLFLDIDDTFKASMK